MHMAMKNVRMQIGEAHLESEGWYQKLDENARRQYRESARSLAQGLMNYLASENDDDSEAHAIGYEYASRARRYSLSEVDATRALLFFRNALIESVNTGVRGETGVSLNAGAPSRFDSRSRSGHEPPGSIRFPSCVLRLASIEPPRL